MSLQEKIIDETGVRPVIDPQEEVRKSIDFLKEYLYKNPFLKTFVLGISGGQDSSLAGRLSQLAMEEVRHETKDSDYHFIAVRLPYGTQADEEDATQAIEFIQPDTQIEVDIKPAVDAQVSSLREVGMTVSDFNKGNIKARQRMVAQYAIAGEFSGAVIGTDHAAENITGFFTKFGDGAADLLPIFRLNKRQGRLLLQELNAPEELYVKVPTADLEEEKPQISDEAALGVSYDEIDDYLEGKEIASRAQSTIEDLWEKSQHKRHQPISIFTDFWK